METEFCQLWLTCENEKEATKIAKVLLEKKLIACAKQLPLTSEYWWGNTIEHANEILLIMETQLVHFDVIEAEVARLHSYETFVLQALPMQRLSKKASLWLLENSNPSL